MSLTTWTEDLATEHIHSFNEFNETEKTKIINDLNKTFTHDKFIEQLKKAESAIKNSEEQSTILAKGNQLYPETVKINNEAEHNNLIEKFAIVLMAGGEGERLRLSLLEKGYKPEDLQDFTKATFPLPNFPEGFGALQTNLLVIGSLCKKYSTDIPVIITTGPKGSTTADLIPKIIKKSNNFGLENVKVIAQNERLHLSIDKKIVIKESGPATNPDETGGPIMKLKERTESEESVLDWLETLQKEKIMVLQATALYDPSLIETMALAAKDYDGLGIGIERENFPEKDPYGTFVLIEENGKKSLRIIEQAIRNDKTRELQNSEGKYLPFNTGFYIFDSSILQSCDLPDYSTPAKEVTPDLPKAPKIGYAATDIIAFAEKPAVLTISKDSFAVIKDASDPERLSILAKKYGLQELCKEFLNQG